MSSISRSTSKRSRIENQQPNILPSTSSKAQSISSKKSSHSKATTTSKTSKNEKSIKHSSSKNSQVLQQNNEQRLTESSVSGKSKSSYLTDEEKFESVSETEFSKPAALLKSGKPPLVLEFSLSEMADQSQSDASSAYSEGGDSLSGSSKNYSYNESDSSSRKVNIPKASEQKRRNAKSMRRNRNDDDDVDKKPIVQKTSHHRQHQQPDKFKITPLNIVAEELTGSHEVHTRVSSRRVSSRSEIGEEEESLPSVDSEDQKVNPRNAREEELPNQIEEPKINEEEERSSRTNSRTSTSSRIGVLLLGKEGDEAEGQITLHTPKSKANTRYFSDNEKAASEKSDANKAASEKEITRSPAFQKEKNEGSSFPLDEKEELSASYDGNEYSGSLSESAGAISSSTDGAYSYMDEQSQNDGEKSRNSDYPFSKMGQLSKFPHDPNFMDTENEPDLVDEVQNRSQLYAEIEKCSRDEQKSTTCLLL